MRSHATPQPNDRCAVAALDTLHDALLCRWSGSTLCCYTSHPRAVEAELCSACALPAAAALLPASSSPCLRTRRHGTHITGCRPCAMECTAPTSRSGTILLSILVEY